jgi:hypothetical protein
MKNKAKYLLIPIFIVITIGCIVISPAVDNAFENFTPTFETVPSLKVTENSRTINPTFAEISTPLVTITPMLDFVWTPDSTFSEIDASKKVLDWWGIIPGKTTWLEAQQFLVTMSTKIEQGGSGSYVENGTTYQTTNYSVFYNIYGDTGGGGINLGVTNGVIATIFIGGGSTKYNFRLSQILSKYGQPDNIFLSTYKDTPDSPPLFIVVLYYRNFQFLATFETNAQKIGDKLIGCPQSESPGIHIWKTNETVTDKDIEKWAIGPDPTSPLMNFNDVTDISVEEFYQIFVNPDNKECIETPAEYWP